MNTTVSQDNNNKMLYKITYTGCCPDGKFDMNFQYGFHSHRSGWGKIMRSCASLHNDDGVYMNGFLDKTFGWRLSGQQADDWKMHVKSWVGIFHNPPSIPSWYNQSYTLKAMISSPEFLRTLESCRGIYTTTVYVKDWLSLQLGPNSIEVNVIHLPFACDTDIMFSLDKYMCNNDKVLVDVGTWLRRLSTIHIIDTPKNITPIKLWPNGFEPGSERRRFADMALERECSYLNIDLKRPNVSNINGLDINMYDKLLAQNIVLLDFWDTSANNTVLECIERGTPLLVRRHPAVEEYLGLDYPLFFNDIEECKSLLHEGNIARSNKYLLDIKHTGRFTIDSFLFSIKSSSIYQNL